MPTCVQGEQQYECRESRKGHRGGLAHFKTLCLLMVSGAASPTLGSGRTCLGALFRVARRHHGLQARPTILRDYEKPDGAGHMLLCAQAKVACCSCLSQPTSKTDRACCAAAVNWQHRINNTNRPSHQQGAQR